MYKIIVIAIVLLAGILVFPPIEKGEAQQCVDGVCYPNSVFTRQPLRRVVRRVAPRTSTIATPRSTAQATLEVAAAQAMATGQEVVVECDCLNGGICICTANGGVCRCSETVTTAQGSYTRYGPQNGSVCTVSTSNPSYYSNSGEVVRTQLVRSERVFKERPVRSFFRERKPVRRLLGRIFSRIRGCR